MKRYTIFYKVFLLAAVFFASSCETVDLEQTENPSAVNPDLLDPTFAFNYVQLQLPGFVNSTNGFTQGVTRQMAMTGGSTYDNAYAPVNFNGHWSTAYNLLNAIKVMEPKAVERNQNYILGASKVIRCYVLMTLVDVYGDIPYSESLQGSANITPNFDSSAAVYDGILTELDQAIATLQLTNNGSVTDLYYTSKEKWITLANTLKLKMYNNCNLLTTIGTRNVATEMNAIIAADDYIDTPAEDFVFKYGSSRQNPNTRHPMYNDQYELGGGAYIGNYIMWAMTTEKLATTAFPNTIDEPGDPRVNFYFYRQDPNPGNEDNFVLPGRTRPEHYNETRYSSFYSTSIGACYTVSNWIGGALPANGFWGRDHGNNSGIPQDNDKRSVAGVYPIGGAYGAAGTVQTQGTKGAKGAGIMPIILSSWVRFMKAEAMLKGIISGDAKAEMLTAISQSIDKTTTVIPVTPALTSAEVADISVKKQKYLDYISTTFDGLNDAKKLELLIKEFYIATWGNGIEPYNNYRRTGYPSNFQPTLEPNSGVFYNCAFYAGNCVNNNPNAPANDRARKVFWAEPNTKVLH
ncbi:MAG: SusD/RagB family nutrient-binding outer membrane lipoprotein [Flavobacterium sp.]|nr:SusD/RagB family nutrient-binding outer membrane lipoprotein [Flavobacterium sp.]